MITVARARNAAAATAVTATLLGFGRERDEQPRVQRDELVQTPSLLRRAERPRELELRDARHQVGERVPRARHAAGLQLLLGLRRGSAAACAHAGTGTRTLKLRVRGTKRARLRDDEQRWLRLWMH